MGWLRVVDVYFRNKQKAKLKLNGGTEYVLCLAVTGQAAGVRAHGRGWNWGAGGGALSSLLGEA